INKESLFRITLFLIYWRRVGQTENGKELKNTLEEFHVRKYLKKFEQGRQDHEGCAHPLRCCD
ncbi:hypothetical protein LEMLEM_LOCUS6445, partial [Lemmus lemmus]